MNPSASFEMSWQRTYFVS